MCIDHASDDKDNMLAAAIWCKEIPVHVDEDFNHLPKPNQTLEIIDEDDEEATNKNIEYNKIAYTPVSSYQEPIYAEEYFTKEQKTYNEIFDELLDIGHNYKNINVDGQNLLHLAAKRDNIHVLNKLLVLGLDSMAPDLDGNTPIHLVTGANVFRKLYERNGMPSVTEKNNKGETILHVYVIC